MLRQCRRWRRRLGAVEARGEALRRLHARKRDELEEVLNEAPANRRRAGLW